MIGLLDGTIDWDLLAESYGGPGGLLNVDVSADDVARELSGRLVYLATPYTKQVRDAETGKFVLWMGEGMAQEAARWSAILAASGITAISPIVAAQAIIETDASGGIDPFDHKFWTDWCWPLLTRSQAVVVPPIVGWERSSGVFCEAAHALRAVKRVMVIKDDMKRRRCRG
ncbi:DUF1937 family protein [Celeribacter sp.]|uniref:DUF1937 family protein n=1 Tax=Celeribacter sp. TaxID=1890673 RepID=UPI003A922277